MKIKNCLIRCDYNSKSGFGHLFRMLALAGELRKTYRWNIIFVISESSADDKFISSNNFEIIRINTDNSNSEKNCINRIINLNETNLIVFDIKTELKQTFLNSLQNRNIMVVTIDDSSERRLSSDLCFYPPVPQTSELDWRGFNGKIYHGADWILLREEFLSYENVEDKSKTLLHPKRILLTMGGSDPAGFTLLAIEALELITGDIDVDVLIGPSFLHQEKLKDLLRNSTKKIKIHKKIRQPADLMKKADLSIASFGMTAFELAAMGIPSILICLSQDHMKSATALVDAGASIVAGVKGTINKTDITKNISKIFADDLNLRKMSQNGVQFIDGKGRERIAETIDHYFTKEFQNL